MQTRCEALCNDYCRWPRELSNQETPDKRCADCPLAINMASSAETSRLSLFTSDDAEIHMKLTGQLPDLLHLTAELGRLCNVSRCSEPVPDRGSNLYRMYLTLKSQRRLQK